MVIVDETKTPDEILGLIENWEKDIKSYNEQIKIIQQKVIDHMGLVITHKKYLRRIDREAKSVKFEFMNLENCEFNNIGLHNRICNNPAAICTLKNVNLNYRDIRRRKCLMRLCHNLKWL